MITGILEKVESGAFPQLTCEKLLRYSVGGQHTGNG
jgi:hypothetical protein